MITWFEIKFYLLFVFPKYQLSQQRRSPFLLPFTAKESVGWRARRTDFKNSQTIIRKKKMIKKVNLRRLLPQSEYKLTE